MARDATAIVTVPRDCDEINGNPVDVSPPDEYLSDVSPKHKPWDTHRGEADDVATVFEESVCVAAGGEGRLGLCVLLDVCA